MEQKSNITCRWNVISHTSLILFCTAPNEWRIEGWCVYLNQTDLCLCPLLFWIRWIRIFEHVPRALLASTCGSVQKKACEPKPEIGQVFSCHHPPKTNRNLRTPTHTQIRRHLGRRRHLVSRKLQKFVSKRHGTSSTNLPTDLPFILVELVRPENPWKSWRSGKSLLGWNMCGWIAVSSLARHQETSKFLAKFDLWCGV